MRDVAHDYLPLYSDRAVAMRDDAPLAAPSNRACSRSVGTAASLARTTFPGVAVLCYHGVRDNTLAQRTIPLQYLHIRRRRSCRTVG